MIVGHRLSPSSFSTLTRDRHTRKKGNTVRHNNREKVKVHIDSDSEDMPREAHRPEIESKHLRRGQIPDLPKPCSKIQTSKRQKQGAGGTTRYEPQVMEESETGERQESSGVWWRTQRDKDTFSRRMRQHSQGSHKVQLSLNGTGAASERTPSFEILYSWHFDASRHEATRGLMS